MWLMILLIIIVAIIALGIILGKNEAKASLKIATFGLNISVYDLELSNDSFSIYVDFDNSGNKIRFYGQSIGEVQFGISKACKRRAQALRGNDFDRFMKDYKQFDVGVLSNGERLTFDQYVKQTTGKMRSRKNPITRIERYKHNAPLSGYGEIVYREKL